MMNRLISDPTEIHEIRRLEALLPAELRSRVAITRSARVNPALIATEISKNRLSIRIDLLQWQQLSANRRDLLFWHEVARIQSKTISQFQWETVVMSAGLFVSLIEIVSQNPLSLAVALVVTGLAGHQLYQRNRGERSLREATLADRGAVNLAVQFGYSFPQAYNSLHDSLMMLAKQTPQKSLWRRYEVRLRVLEIFAEKSKKASRQTPLETDVTLARVKARKLAFNTLAYDIDAGR